MDFEFFSQTDTGRIRNNNEDSVAMDPAAGVAVLADGMGGYNAGEVASQMACDFILGEMVRWLFEASKSATDADVKRAMDICVDNANRAIFTAAPARRSPARRREQRSVERRSASIGTAGSGK